MNFDLDQAISVLERTPKVLSELLLGLDEVWTLPNEGQDSWSPFDVIGHLLHGEATDSPNKADNERQGRQDLRTLQSICAKRE